MNSASRRSAASPPAPRASPKAPADCPDSSKIGTARIDAPAVVGHPLEGVVYLATPHQNPFDSLLAFYISVNDPQSGVVTKLPGLIEADPQTGRLTVTISEMPAAPLRGHQLRTLQGLDRAAEDRDRLRHLHASAPT